MKKDNILLYVLLGTGALGLWYWYKKNNAKKEIKVIESDLVSEVIKEETDKYGNPFNAQYRIVMPYQMVSKKVKAKGEELRLGRYAPNFENIKSPLYI